MNDDGNIVSPLHYATPVARRKSVVMKTLLRVIASIFLVLVAVSAVVVFHEVSLIRANAKGRARRAMMWQQYQNCMSEMTQIGKALKHYAQDHGGRYPDSLEALVGVGSSYIPDDTIFIDPAANSDLKPSALCLIHRADGYDQFGSYVYVGKGATLSSVQGVPILFEPNTPYFGDGYDTFIFVLAIDGGLRPYYSLDEAVKDSTRPTIPNTHF